MAAWPQTWRADIALRGLGSGVLAVAGFVISELGAPSTSGGTTLLHRSIYLAARHGPAQVLELALGLTSFILASIGVLLLIHGARLFTRTPVRAANVRPRHLRDGDPALPIGRQRR